MVSRGQGKTARLGLVAATALVAGNMIGSGIFLLPSALAPYGGLALGGWLVSLTGILALAWVFADFSRHLPRLSGARHPEIGETCPQTPLLCTTGSCPSLRRSLYSSILVTRGQPPHPWPEHPVEPLEVLSMVRLQGGGGHSPLRRVGVLSVRALALDPAIGLVDEELAERL